MLTAAREIDRLYQKADKKRLGRNWTLAEFLSQCALDWGELAEVIGKHQGFRDGEYKQKDAEHELGDLLWALIVISDRLEIDLQEALLKTMSELRERLDK